MRNTYCVRFETVSPKTFIRNVDSSSLCDYKNNPKPVEFLIDEITVGDGNAIVLKHISRDENNKKNLKIYTFDALL
jgi:hypothetical protein